MYYRHLRWGKIFDRLHVCVKRVVKMESSKEIIKRMLTHIAQTQEKELDCGEVYQVVDVFAEAIARGEDPTELLPMVKHHLELCRDCGEEYEALLRILEADIS
jgi:hypothetical protein